MIFISIAYRYGEMNNSDWVLVGASTDPDKAIEQAKDYHVSRGAKYGVAVYMTRDADPKKEKIMFHYIPSCSPHDHKSGPLFAGWKEGKKLPKWARAIFSHWKDV